MLILLLIGSVASKFVSTTLTLGDKNNWRYISKFATDIGRAEWRIRAKFQKPIDENGDSNINLTVSVFLDTTWDEAVAGSTCEEKVHTAKREKMLSLPKNGDWSSEVMSTLTQRSRTYFWFFALSDCHSSLPSKHKIKIEMNMINSDGSQFSSEQKGLLYLYPLLLLVFLPTFYKNFQNLLARRERSDESEHSLLILTISIGCQFVGLIFEIFHLCVYAYDGSGVVVFDFFYQALGLISSMCITALFILMAYGWTLKYQELPDSDTLFPVCTMIGVVNLMIVGMGRIIDDAYYKFSEYDGVPGALVLLIRFSLWVWFLFLMRKLYGEGTAKYAGFALNFGVLASLYFLAQPVLLIFSWVFATYWRNCVFSIGTLAIQGVVFYLMTHLFSERSQYYKVSTLSRSVLPGGK